jgi:DNA modification methylase
MTGMTGLTKRAKGTVAPYSHSCEAMPELSDGSVDRVGTSPPYRVRPDDRLLAPALLRGAAGKAPGRYDALLRLLSRCFTECFRVLKPGGTTVPPNHPLQLQG